MTWDPKPPEPNFPDDAGRVVVRFLWLPRTLKGVTKWLEPVLIEQRWRRTYGDMRLQTGIPGWWADVRFVDPARIAARPAVTT